MLVAGLDALLVVGADGEVTPGPAVLPAQPVRGGNASGSGRRLNDGACDPAGAFLVGSLDVAGRAGGEVLVRVGRDRRVTVLDDDLTLSNGLAFTPDGQLYSIDSVPGVVWARDYDAATGAAGKRRELLRLADTTPDGMCLGADGSLWIACWGAGEVRRFTPAGELSGVVSVPTAHVSSVAFAGPGLDLLVITTARQGARDADAGKLFLADVGATGLPVPYWAGFDTEEI
jgi:sugar lactone lactonase YvrE